MSHFPPVYTWQLRKPDKPTTAVAGPDENEPIHALQRGRTDIGMTMCFDPVDDDWYFDVPGEVDCPECLRKLGT